MILFPDDPFVSPLHATLMVKDGRVVIRDEESTSGCYVSVAGQETKPADSYFCTGLRLFRYAGALEPAPPFVPGRMVVYGAPVPPNQVHYQVEEILLAHPAVAECGVTGAPHPYWGEQVTAFVVLRAGMNATAEDLTAACREKLSRYKVPKEIRFMPALPRNTMGKVLRRALRDSLKNPS